jgi:hypothetical protein
MRLREKMDPAALAEIQADRQGNLDIIEEEFTAAGLPLEFAAAAFANVWHESKFNTKAQGDFKDGHPQSIGLFQLKAPSGAGHGMTIAEREDPRLNTRRIIEQVQKKYGDEMRADYGQGERRISHFAALFCRDIERPRDKTHCWGKRADTAVRFFPGDALSHPLPPSKWIPWVIMGGSVGLLVFALWRKYTK